jgi:glutaredoxin 3
MQIIVYSTTTCPYCKMLKDYLVQKNILFTEKQVDTDPTAKDEMMKKSGGYLGVPFSVVTKDTGEEVRIVGFDRMKFDEIMGVTTI